MLPLQAAAYTRARILRLFLTNLENSVPAIVDAAYARTKLGLKGGDVRALLQSLRVLGLVDPYGRPTELARRARTAAGRASAVTAGLEQAYPLLYDRWKRGVLRTRQDVEDHFKVEHQLSASSAAAAARLFLDLAQEFAPASARQEQEPVAAQPEPALAAGEMHAQDETAPEPSASDLRKVALDTIRSSLQIQIDSNWDNERIALVFDRLERLVDQVMHSEDRETGRR